MTPLHAAQEIIDKLELDLAAQDIGIDITPRIQWDVDGSPTYFNITFRMHHDKLTPEQRRAMKRIVKLDVPAWALDSSHKPLEGTTHYFAGDILYPAVDVEFYVSGAFECVAVGEEEVEPDQRTQAEADTLARMSPEEALEHVRKEAERLRKPAKKTRYSCKPRA